jgi:predicted ester cyclase
LDTNVATYGPDPINELQGAEGYLKGFWIPLRTSFSDLRRHTHLFVSGYSNGRVDGDESKDGRLWVSGTGVFSGTFTEDYLGLPATGKQVDIRFGEFCEFHHGKIVSLYYLIDLVDLFEQAGIHVLPPSRGKPMLYPPPTAGDGVLAGISDPAQTRYSLEHIRRFIFDGLNSYDQSELRSMGMKDYFAPDVRWYGPGGIGACLRFSEFEELHQRPWLVAFPDRRVQDLTALFAEGNYTGAPGWAGVVATHAGPYLDCPPSGKRVEINGLDWWKREGEQYIENWVFVDMIHLFRQFGVDLMARMRVLAAGKS